MVPPAPLARMVTTKIPITLARNALPTPMLFLELPLVPLVPQANGLQLELALAQTVLTDATHAPMDPLVILVQMVIPKTAETLVPNVLQAPMPSLDPLHVPLADQLNGQQQDLAVALIVSLAVPHVQTVQSVLAALEVMPRTQEILVLNVLLAITLPLDRPVVLLVDQPNGQQLDLLAAQTVSLVVLRALMVPLVTLAQMVIIKMVEVLVLNAPQELILWPEPPFVPLVARVNGQLMELALVEAVLVAVAHALMAPLVTLALVVIPKIQEIPVLNVLQEPMLLLDLQVALLAAQPNGQQLELVPALIVSLVVSHVLEVQLVPLVLVVIIKIQETLVPNVLLVIMLLLELLVALHAVQANGPQLEQAVAQIVSVGAPHAQPEAPVLHAQPVIIKTQETLVPNASQEPTLPLELQVVLPVTQINGQQTEPAVVLAVSLDVPHALMVPLVILALLVIIKIQEILAQNVLQTLMPLLELPVVLHAVQANGH